MTHETNGTETAPEKPTLEDHPMIHPLESGEKKIQLIGTAHVSHESAELVETVIRREKPDTVCIELCPSRYQALKQKDRWRNMNILKVIREKKAFLLLLNLLLASFQKRIAEQFGIQPGQEMIKAVEAAETTGAEISLADRDIRVTLSRTWRLMGFWEKMKLVFQMMLSIGQTEEVTEEEIERMKQEDILETLLAEIGKSHPALRDILIDERDQYLCEKIRSAPGERIVAVVGAGHVPGIKRYLGREVDLEALEEVPPGGKLSKLLKWGIPAVIVALLVLGFYLGGSKTGTEMLSWWILANSILAGLGAVLALAHPLTILSAIVAAPLTSLNPMIAAGWVAGIVEAVIRKPKVGDFEDLPRDITTMKGFWNNKVTRILLVVVFTNLGSVLGTIVGGTFIMKAMIAWIVQSWGAVSAFFQGLLT
jgi:pheromone shutdown-related protein TraB